MNQYTLRFPADNAAGERIVNFSAETTANALELAQQSASGERADLFEDGRLICRMRLVEETGVWLIHRTNEGEPEPSED